jgi:D-inositol-3-phosphate glycosyltransferase
LNQQTLSRIALIVPDLAEDGGVKTVARFVLDAIESSGRYESTIISLATSARDACSLRLLAPRTWIAGVRCEKRDWLSHQYAHIGALFPEFEFQRYRKRALLSELVDRCDLVQVVSGSPALGYALSDLGKPVVLQVATRAVVERRRQASQARGLKASWRRQMTRVTDRFDLAAIRHADAVIVENRWMEAYCTEVSRGHGTRTVYAPPGVDASMFRPSPHRLRSESGSPYILSVGRLHDERKNIGLLLDAYREVRRLHAAFPKLVLAGATPPPESFWTRARTFGLLDEIRFIHKPPLADLIALYQGATCFALSSDEEGFGMVLIESMACGVPAVATRCGGPDGIIDDATDGYLVPLNDPRSLAARLESLCLDQALNTRMGDKARQKIIEAYDLPIAGRRFIRVYDELLQVSTCHQEQPRKRETCTKRP